MAEEKNVTDNNIPVNEGEKPQDQTATPENKEKFGDKIKAGWSKHKKKILTGIGLAGAFATGMLADKIGIKLGQKDDQQPDDAE